MLKKILLGTGVLLLVLLLLFLYANNRNRTLSPPGKVELDVDQLHIEISYSRPSVRDRLIFGSDSDGALQPYGNYWRLGANEATEITVNQDVTFNGKALKAGTYRLYAIPGPQTFKIGVNTELGKWGAWEPDYSKDLFVTEVPVSQPDAPIEQFTARIENGAENGAIVYFEWSNVQLSIPIGLDSGK
jgi:hypothetical protein